MSNELIVGEVYLLDSGFNNAGLVKLVSKSELLLCKVQDIETGEEWETMQYRLSAIPSQQNPTDK